MRKLVRKRSHKAGLPPATLVPVAKSSDQPTRITVMDYDENNYREMEIHDLSEVLPLKDLPTVTWVNIDGLTEIKLLEGIGETFGLHPLVLEDILSIDQRPKMDDFEDYIFIVLRMLFYDKEHDEIKNEQVSLILGHNFVLSFQQFVGDVFDPVRERIRTEKGRVRKRGSDYLAYALMDVIVDNYFAILENMGDKIESAEEELVENPNPKILKIFHDQKKDLIFLRKSVWPLREVINNLERGESPLIKKPTKIFLRDVYDHIIQVIDTVETLRDTVSGLLDLYLSVISNRMNEVMKVLTIIATIFIPLTFIAGIYGMNFVNMPELNWRWGYFIILIWMVVIGIIMTAYFKRKHWL